MKKLSVLFLLLLAVVNSMDAQVWTQKEDFPNCRYEGVSFTIEETVYYGLGMLCGSGGETQTFFKYDTNTNSWTPIANFPGSTRRLATAFAIDGKGYVGLGYSNGVSKKDFWQYSPDTDTWTAMSDFSGTARGAAMADVVNGKAYVGTGFGPGTASLYPMDFWQYSPTTDSWTQKASFPASSLALYRAENFVIGDTLYSLGGVGNGDLLKHSEFWAYSTTNDTWTQLIDIPGTARTKPVAFAIDDAGYFGYGFQNGATYMGDFYQYNPNTETWIQISSNGMGGMLFDASGVTSSGKTYSISGVTASNPSPPTSDLWEFVPGVLNVNDFNDASNRIQIVPNPVVSISTINVNKAGNYVIYNILGQKIQEISIDETLQTTLNKSNFNNGIYIVVSKENSLMQTKFIVN